MMEFRSWKAKHGTFVLLLTVFVSSISTSTANAGGVYRYCGNTPADVVFLLDSSNSVWAPDFHRMLRFVANVSEMFTIGPNDTQVGLAIFNDRVELQFHLNRYAKKESLIEAIYEVPQIYGTHTATDVALKFMHTQMFHRGTGMRPDVVHIAIVITDGRSENGMQTLIEAARAKFKGIHIFTVGVGGAIYIREIRRIASAPASENAFSVNDYGILRSIQRKLAIQTCLITPPPTTTTTTTTTTTPTTTTTTTTPTTTTTTTTTTSTTPTTTTTTTPTTTTTTTPTTTTTTPTTTTTTTTPIPTTTPTTTTTTTTPVPTTTWVDTVRQICHGKPVDIVFAIDSSDAITRADYWHQRKFVRDFTLGLDIGPNKTRIGAVLYSDYVVHGFDVTDHGNLKGAIADLYAMERIEGGTRLDEVIRYVRTKSYRRSVSRNNVAQLLVLLTGSASSNIHRVKKQVKLAEKTGVNILTIAFGDNVNDQELSVIGGNLDSSQDHRLSELASFMMEDQGHLQKKLFKVTTSEDLDDVVVESVTEACLAKKMVTPVSDQACGTRQEADMMLVMDSTSAGKTNTKKTMDFMKNVTKDMKVERKGGVQVGMVIPEECKQYTQGFGLSKHDQDGIARALETHLDEDGISDMLRHVRRDGFRKRKGGRRDAKKIAIVIIDGFLDKPLKALKEARRAQIKGIEVFVIMVGQDRPQPEISEMCDYPPKKHFFQVPDYDRLKAIEDDLIEILCDEL